MAAIASFAAQATFDQLYRTVTPRECADPRFPTLLRSLHDYFHRFACARSGQLFQPNSDRQIQQIRSELNDFCQFSLAIQEVGGCLSPPEIKQFHCFHQKGREEQAISVEQKTLPIYSKWSKEETGLPRDIFVTRSYVFISFNNGEKGDRVYSESEVIKPGLSISLQGDVLPIVIKSMKSNLQNLCEARIHQSLCATEKGKHFIKWFWHWMDGKAIYLILEMADKDLKTAIGTPSLAKNQKEWALQCIQAIKALHELGYIHRDIKPENFLLLVAENAIKLADFGFCCEEKKATNIHGSPAYFGPECFKLEAGTAATDIWAYGCMLFELFTGGQLHALPWMPINYDALEPKALFLSIQPFFKDLPPDWKPTLPSTSIPIIDELLKDIFQLDPKNRPTAADIEKRLSSSVF